LNLKVVSKSNNEETLSDPLAEHMEFNRFLKSEEQGATLT